MIPNKNGKSFELFPFLLSLSHPRSGVKGKRGEIWQLSELEKAQKVFDPSTAKAVPQ